MILTTVQAYIFKYRPSTRWWIAIPATCEPGREALTRATVKSANCRLTDFSRPTALSILLEPIARWKRPCKNWLPILMRGLLEKLQCGHCKIWKPSFLLFSAGCTSLIVYLPSDRSSVMSATTTEATNALNLTLKRASQKLGLATPYRLLSSWSTWSWSSSTSKYCCCVTQLAHFLPALPSGEWARALEPTLAVAPAL